MRKWLNGLLLTVLAAIVSLGISCDKEFLNNTDYDTGSSAAKDVSGSPQNELSALMHQQVPNTPVPLLVPQDGTGLPVLPQGMQKSIIASSVVNPDLPLTVVLLDEFCRPTDTLKANLNDVVYIELQGVTAGYYNGAVLVRTTGADIISIEEGYDYWWNGIGLWWTTASADPTRGGAGNLYYYNHIHSPDNDTYKSEGSSWSAAWQAEGVQYGYTPGPAGSLVTGTAISEARFYFSGYLGDHSATRPGLRLGLKIKDISQVGIDISGHNRYEFSWLNLSPVYNGTITLAPRVNYQSVHNEGENAWIQVSVPVSATVGETISVSAYGELMMDANEYSASVEIIDSAGVTTTLTSTDIAVGNAFGPVSFSVDITHASIWWGRATMRSLGGHPGPNIWAEMPFETSRRPDNTWPTIDITIDPPLNAESCTNTAGNVAVTITAEDPEVPGERCSGLKQFKYELFVNDVSKGVTTPPITSTTITLTGEGRYKIHAWAIDNVNHRTDKTPDIIIDPTAPVVIGPKETIEPGSTPTNTPYTSATTITITKTVSDTSGTDQVEVYISGEDAQGNTVTATRTAKPTVVSRTGNRETIKVTVDLPDGIADGEFSITERVIDKAGNTSEAKYFNPLLDTVAPTLTITRNKQPDTGVWYTSKPISVKLTLTATDPPPRADIPASGIKVPQPNPKDVPFNKDGIYTNTYQAEDNAGNKSAPQTVVVNIDTTPPDVPNGNVTLISPIDVNLSYAEVVAKLNAKITDKTSGVTDGNKSYSGIPAGGLLYGSRNTTVTVTAKDNANNSITKEIKVSVLDREPGK